MSCGAKRPAKLQRPAKLPGYEVLFVEQHRGRKMHLYCETECFQQICNYYQLHIARFGDVRLGRRVNKKFRESVHISPHIGAHLGFLSTCILDIIQRFALQLNQKVFESAPISTLFHLSSLCMTSDVFGRYFGIRSNMTINGPVSAKVVQQVAERVARQAPFEDDPLLQRMKFSPKWCAKMLRLFLSSGMPKSRAEIDSAATCPRVPVVHSVSLEQICNSNREPNVQRLCLQISSGVNS
jgi:hypothetical protein